MTALPTRGEGAGTGPPLDGDAPNGLFTGPPDDPDRYELLGTATSGGEGVLWRARYRGNLTSPVTFAVKALFPQSDGRPWPAPADLIRWRDHRHLLQSLRNDHLVHVHDIFVGSAPHPSGTAGPDGGVPYVVMEWVTGRTLGDALRGAPGAMVDRLRHVRDLAEAVTTLHSATRTSGNPLLHRDIKPDNCILDDARGAVLVDVGTLRRVDDGHDPRGPHTRLYTAPEVLEDLYAPRRVASDLYGLGAVAYFCAVGNDPPAADEEGAFATVRDELRAAAIAARIPRPGTFVDHLAAMLDPHPGARPSRPVLWAEQAMALAAAGRARRRMILGAFAATAVAVVGLLALVASLTAGPAPATTLRPAAVGAFAAFGTSFTRFGTVIDGDRLGVDPPPGYDHLWGLHAPGDNCASTVEFDAQVIAPEPGTAFGYAIAPRAVLGYDQPIGYSVQYEWQPADMNDEPGSYVRPAELPGGAWRGTDLPAPAPDITERHHVVVRATGTRMEIDVDGAVTAFDVPGVECGGVSLRVWGAPVEFSGVTVTGS